MILDVSKKFERYRKGDFLVFIAQKVSNIHLVTTDFKIAPLTLNIPSLGRQRCLPSWGTRRTPWFFFVISQLFDAVDYSNYVFLVSETIIQ